MLIRLSRRYLAPYSGLLLAVVVAFPRLPRLIPISWRCRWNA